MYVESKNVKLGLNYAVATINWFLRACKTRAIVTCFY